MVVEVIPLRTYLQVIVGNILFSFQKLFSWPKRSKKFLLFQVAWIDKVDRRYSWMKRVLVKFEEDFNNTFPPEWAVDEKMAVEFCDITRLVILMMLSLVSVWSKFV